MSIPILVEPSAGGFRATVGGPLDLAVEAESAAAAVVGLRLKIADRIRGGAMIIEQSFPAPPSPIAVLSLAENPLFDDWLAAVEDYRNRREGEEKAADTVE